MIVTCDSCGARYKLDDKKIAGRGAKITCPRCKHVFVVYLQGQDRGATSSAGARPAAASSDTPTEVPTTPPMSQAAPAAPKPAPAPAPPRRTVERPASAVGLDFRSLGIDSWKVKKTSIGLVYDYHDFQALERSLKEGRISGADQLSHDGKTWSPIGDIPNLEAHFIDIYVAAAEGSPVRLPPPPMPDDEATVVDDSDDLAAAMNSAAAELDATGGSRLDDDLRAAMSRASSGKGGGEPQRFADPFKAHKERRRTSGPATPAFEQGADEPGGMGMRTVIAAGLLLGVGGAAAWYGYTELIAPPPPAPPVTVSANPDPSPSETVSEEDRKRQAVQQDLREIFEDAEEERAQIVEAPPEDQLIPVVPEHLRNPRGKSVNTTPSGGGTTAVAATGSTASDHYEAGRDAAARGDWRSAAEAYGRAASMDPSNATYKESLGAALYRSGDLDRASRELAQAASSGSVAANKWLGNIARDQGDVSGAVGHYRRYLESGPADASAVQAEIDKLTR